MALIDWRLSWINFMVAIIDLPYARELLVKHPLALYDFHKVSGVERSRIDFHGDLVDVVADAFQLNQQRLDVLGNVNLRVQRCCNEKICNAELSLLCFLLNHFFLCFCPTNRQSFCSFSVVLHTFLKWVRASARFFCVVRTAMRSACPSGRPLRPSPAGKSGPFESCRETGPELPQNALLRAWWWRRTRLPPKNANTGLLWPNRGARAADGGLCWVNVFSREYRDSGLVRVARNGEYGTVRRCITCGTYALCRDKEDLHQPLSITFAALEEHTLSRLKPHVL